MKIIYVCFISLFLNACTPSHYIPLEKIPPKPIFFWQQTQQNKMIKDSRDWLKKTDSDLLLQK